MVDLAVDLRRAGRDAAAADLHGRRAAQRARHADRRLGARRGRPAMSTSTVSTQHEPLLSLERLHVRFGDTVAVDDVTLAIGRGERVALVGESGSGKSVTALSILRLLRDAEVSGAICFAGQDLVAKSEREMRGLRGSDIAMIFQEPMTALNPLYTIGVQIGETIVLHDGVSAVEARKRAIALLARTGIAEPEKRVDSYPHQLSGGQRQRAMIAMALACRPRLLLADEPTTALDVT
ncbi:ATP-binding cassette domain-containing protein, partial [Burkholderia cenocepacia]|uniref:ATP-binding cassette domain-containing protein n=1 Tax=Burkholderia cenocepacia TaxID=95486 RepID=UPI0027413270